MAITQCPMFRIVKLGTKNQLERDAIFVLTDCALQAAQHESHYLRKLILDLSGVCH